MLTIRVVDVEHTGEEDIDPAPFELAWVSIYSEGTNLAGEPARWTISPTDQASITLNPGRPIPPGASSVTHVIDEDIAECPPWEAGIDELFTVAHEGGRPDPDYYAAFAGDEAKLLGKWISPGTRWIDIHKVALRCWPDAPRWNLQTLRYWRKPLGLVRGRASPSHRAYPDAYVAAHLLRDLMDYATVDQMVQWSAEPALQVICYYGDHRGKRWSEVDAGFLNWILGKDFPEDVVFTVKHELKRREAAWEREREAQAGTKLLEGRIEGRFPDYDEPPPYSFSDDVPF